MKVQWQVTFSEVGYSDQLRRPHQPWCQTDHALTFNPDSILKMSMIFLFEEPEHWSYRGRYRHQKKPVGEGHDRHQS
jgi:hypothetical protein